MSAGSILVGPTIAIAEPEDKNDVNLLDLTGLNLTNLVISPHYTEKEKINILEFQKKFSHKVIPLTDTQALLIIDQTTTTTIIE